MVCITTDTDTDTDIALTPAMAVAATVLIVKSLRKILDTAGLNR